MNAFIDLPHVELDGITLTQSYFQSILNTAGDISLKEMSDFLFEELPYLWRADYVGMTQRKTDIRKISANSFTYIYDDYASLEIKGYVTYSNVMESRVVGVVGKSEQHNKLREISRLNKWVGPTESIYGKCWDKGHFIAHKSGGLVDGHELNVFIQRRDLNRGWSEAGKRFRAMEKYCSNNVGTFCFIRPIYLNETSQPAFFEYGVLRSTKDLWVELFDNRLDCCASKWRYFFLSLFDSLNMKL